MGRKDKTQKMLVGCPDVFAEILNVLVYDGENVVNEEHLLPAPTESIYPQADNGEALELQQFQDFSMYEIHQDEIRTLYFTPPKTRAVLTQEWRFGAPDITEWHTGISMRISAEVPDKMFIL